MDFPTKYNKDNSNIFSEPGEPTLQEYEYSFGKDGHKMLVKKDSKIDVYSRIQADADSTDINLLMQRFALGDTNAINIKQGMYFDATNMPSTMAEVFEMGLQAEQYFEALPTDLKEMFDNSHSVFFTEMGKKSFDDKMAKYNDRFVNHDFDDVDLKNTDNSPKEVNYSE